MQSVAILTLLLAASSGLALASSQPQSGEQAASPQQPAESVQPQVGSVVPVPPVEHQQQSPPANVEHHQVQPPQASYYAPAGVIQVVGAEQPAKPVHGGQQAARNQPEQYGQPESASIPPNYKPFGSWGLYIGGNPADGYYTNYYKQLSNTVEKQQQVGQVTPAAALNPMLRQAGSSPYVGADYYPFAYSPADFNANAAGRPYGVEPQQPAAVQVLPSGLAYAGHPSFEPHAYPEHYGATKRLGATKATGASESRDVLQSGKGGQQQQRVYPSPAQVVGQLSAPGVASSVVGSNPSGHVVAYPVPIGSQIVGSQQGVDGAFAPYGVHAFTRYAVKPALVGGQAEHAPAHHYYYSQQPAYKQPQQHQQAYYYPQGYGFAPAPAPAQQLYYSQPAVGPQPIVHADGPAYFGPVPSEQFVGDKVVEGVSEVVENKPQVQVVNKPQQS